MIRRRVISAVAIAVWVTPGVVAAGDGRGRGNPPPSAVPYASGDTIGSLIIGPGGQVGGPGARESDGCFWDRVNPTAIDDGNADNDDTAVRRTTNGREQVLVLKWCDGVAVASAWAWATPTPAELTVGLRSVVARRLPPVTPDLSPPGPGYVHLGMWLAVGAEDPVVVANDVAGWSVVVTAVQARTTFRIGDLATESCAGFGTPIVDLDVVDEGPCGYTFRSVPDGGAVPIAITVEWDVTYTTPLGDGSLGTLPVNARVDYRVREIQTVGTGG